MNYRVLTIAREYGSGGAEIATLAAKSLSWKLLDRNLIDKIAHAAGVDVESVTAYDEHVDSWLHRISRPLWNAGLQPVATISPVDIFDSEAMVRVTREIVEEAHSAGECVIVGRAAQCILQGCPDVFHVFVYAPRAERLHRVQERLHSKAEAERMLREVDEERASYVKLYFGRDWDNRQLYDLMISSRAGCRATASIITAAMGAQREA
ncbi:MAG TPA: cytidylate kinase-like family protein [Bryobacteraceae bacterium]|nr:cytidylate kinase-like family protein [Bryobacteraceae bacterium]